MIKEALEYIVGLRVPNVMKIDGHNYSDKKLERISFNPMADAIKMSTLTSLVDYIHTMSDEFPVGKMIVHVHSPQHVSLYSELDFERKRECMVDVNADLPQFQYGRFIDHEEFCIGLQSKFIDSDDRALLLQFAGTVEAGTVAQYGDDGVTQRATIKTGIASKGDAIVPSPCSLRPYRTFLEVDQPASKFVFRMKGESSIVCSLFEADGGAWKMEAMRNVKEYLSKELSEFPQIIIIS